jgi:hypothetical protein
MIDCNITTNYLTERYRMTQKGKPCEVCYGTECPLCAKNNGVGIACVELESSYPEKAIEIVQKWSDEHPPKTYLSEFLKHYPNVQLYDTGIPKGVCPYHLGLMNKDDCRKDRNCIECWNQTVEDCEECSL